MSQAPKPLLANRLLLAYLGLLAASPLLGHLPVFLVQNFYGLFFALDLFPDFPYLPEPLVWDLQYEWGPLAALAVFLGFLTRRYLPRYRGSLGLHPASFREVLELFLFVFAYKMLVGDFMLWIFPTDPFPGLPFGPTAVTPAGWAGYAIGAVLLAPLVEEILFRGFLLRAYAAARGPRFALYAQATLFGLFHPHPLHVLESFGFAWILGRSVLARGSLIPAIAVHALMNALVLARILLVPADPQPTSLLGIWAGVLLLLTLWTAARRFPLPETPPEAPGPVLSGSLALVLLYFPAYYAWHFLGR